VLVLFPIIWMASASISKGSSLFSSSIFPEKITFANYINLFHKTKFLKWLRNSGIVTLMGSLLAMSETTTMAYAFSRFKFKGKKNGLMILILLQMLPSTVTIVALYKLAVFVNVQNTFLGLILIYAGTTIPFNAWLMRGYFDSIPYEIEESAYLDGANHWQAFIKIAFPLCLPMIVVVFLFNLISFYNDYYLASIILSGNEMYTVALGMRFFTQPYAENWSMFAAASVLSCLPIVIIFYSLQKYLVQGLTKGAIKG
jgi:arabinogalactan oligomer/maltooligosaccharide transport system permease protein